MAETWDETPLRVSGKWANKPVMPAVVRWRVRSGRGTPSAWRTAIDFSETIPAPGLFDTVYGRWTRQNHPWRSGRYRVRLALDWDSAAVNDGMHLLEVEAADTRGSRTKRSIRFAVTNRPRGS